MDKIIINNNILQKNKIFSNFYFFVSIFLYANTSVTNCYSQEGPYKVLFHAQPLPSQPQYETQMEQACRRLGAVLPFSLVEKYQRNPIKIVWDSNLKTDGQFLVQNPYEVRLKPELVSQNSFIEILLHESVHLVQAQLDRSIEASWMQEGLAQFLSYSALGITRGYGLDAFMENHGISLEEKYNHESMNPAWYAKAWLTSKFIIEYCTHHETPDFKNKVFWALAGYPDVHFYVDTVVSKNLLGFDRAAHLFLQLQIGGSKIPAECVQAQDLERQTAFALTINQPTPMLGNPYFVFPTTQKIVPDNEPQSLQPGQFQILNLPTELSTFYFENIQKAYFDVQDDTEVYVIKNIYPFGVTRVTQVQDFLSLPSATRILALRLHTKKK